MILLKFYFKVSILYNITGKNMQTAMKCLR